MHGMFSGHRTLAVVVITLASIGVLGESQHTELQAPAADPAQRVTPTANASIPTGPQALATLIEDGDAALRAAAIAWRTDGDQRKGSPPPAVTLEALYLQRILRWLSRNSMLARAVTRRLPAVLAHNTREIVASLIDIRRLAAGHRPRPERIRTGAPEPLGILIGHYRKAQRRFKVGLHVLAAVNLVETAFGRLRNDSYAAAQGPMQFIPATWRAYGLGGDVRDPRDAILGAANYLRASGASNYRRALFHYNPSRLYVNAVLRFARLITRDPEALEMFYSWQVFVRMPGGGDRQVTGPGSKLRSR